MRFERSIVIDAPQQRVWDVLSDLEAWPGRIETVELVELLTPTPLGEGSRVRLSNPGCRGHMGGHRLGCPVLTSSTASMAVASPSSGAIVSRRLEGGRSRLTLTLEMRGLLVLVGALFYKGLTNRYMALEAEGIERAAESA